MSRPSKPFKVIEGEKRSHRTKAELKQREIGEAATLTGQAMREAPEVKSNSRAHKEFRRIADLLSSVGKNDALYEATINRYCLISAECFDFEEKREAVCCDLKELSSDKAELIEGGEMSLSGYYKMKNNMQNTLLQLDRQVQSKRKMLLDMEKENIMTIAAALRSVPKKTEKSSNPLLEVLGGD